MSSIFTREAMLLGASGYALSQARAQMDTGWRWLVGKWFCTVEIASTDDLYDAALRWLHAHESAAGMREMAALTSTTGSNSRPVAVCDSGIPRNAQLYFTQACGGPRLLRDRGRWLWVTRSQRSPGSQFSRAQETLTFRMLTRNPQDLRDFIGRIFASALNLDDDRLSVMALINAYDWGRVQHRKARPLESVVLPAGVAEAVLADCRHFTQNEAWYVARGIPYRRGYLLEGIPGAGKTSLVMALAGALKKDVYYLSLADPSISDAQLGNLLRNISDGAVLLLEDVDAMFHGRERTTEGGTGVTFSGLLNALDGVAAKEGSLTFLTTNHRERLDPALIRPGRVDVEIPFRHAVPEQARRLYAQLVPEAPETECEAFAAWGGDGSHSMAQLQQAAMTGTWPKPA